MRPIQKQRIDSCVYEQLLDNINLGKWKAGDKLPSESELCAILQVSRVSVRSALQKLQALGFIEVVRAKGSFVCDSNMLFDSSRINHTVGLTQKEAFEIAELRSMLEGASVEIILELGGAADLSRMEEAYQGMVKAAEEQALDPFTLHDHHFHQTIILATGNSRLIRIAHIFREDFFHYLTEINKYTFCNLMDESQIRRYFKEAIHWHTDLRDALHNLDPDAPAVQRRHITRNAERLTRYYERKHAVSGTPVP